jgi:hypothetical protein
MLVPEELNFIVTSDPAQGAKNVSKNGSRFTVKLEEAIEIPRNAMNVNLSVPEATIWWTVPNIITGENDRLYVTGPTQANPAAIQSSVLIIPLGLYDASGLNESVQKLLENAGYQTTDGVPAISKPIFTFTTDEATSRIIVRFEYPTVSIDFTPIDTPRDILGFNAFVYGPYVTAPQNITAPNVAGFNTVNYFLLHSDLVEQGIRFNNSYNQTMAQVLIDVAPGSQIVSKPFNPAKSDCSRLAGSRIDTFSVWLTDDSQREVNTNNEYFTARISIRWLHPHVLHENQVKSVSKLPK